MQRELDQLAPVFEASKTDVQMRHEAVEACQKEYATAKDICKKQERDIEGMQGPIEMLKREAQAEFEKVSIGHHCFGVHYPYRTLRDQKQLVENPSCPVINFYLFYFFPQVNPLFNAAWKAINSLNIHDVEELRSYRTPPAIVKLVVDAICVLFEKEQT